MLAIVQRAAQDLVEERVDRLKGRERFAPPYAVAYAFAYVAIERCPEQAALVSVRVVKACGGETCFPGEIFHRRRLVAVPPEALDRCVQHCLFVKFPWSRHLCHLDPSWRSELANFAAMSDYRMCVLKRKG